MVNQNAEHLAVSSGAGNRVQNPVMGLTAPIHLLLESADAQILELFLCQTKSLSDGLILERMLHPADDFATSLSGSGSAKVELISCAFPKTQLGDNRML